MSDFIAAIITNEQLSVSIKSQLIDTHTTEFFNQLETYMQSEQPDSGDIILCEHSVVSINQADVFAALKEKSPNSRILIIGPAITSQLQLDILKQGARGYFDTSVSLDKLDEALRCVAMGEVWLERYVISGLVAELTYEPEISQAEKEAVASLSPKELEVAKLVSHGATNKMIAKKMDITERTVKAHITAIFQKMDLSDRLSLAIFFRDLRA